MLESEEVYTGFGGEGDLMERDHLEDPGIDGTKVYRKGKTKVILRHPNLLFEELGFEPG
jgi:hypothetical protein